jgi:hypothetical protein
MSEEQTRDMTYGKLFIREDLPLQSEKVDLVSKALIQAWDKIKTAKKHAENPFFHSKYADLGAVVEACKGALISSDLVPSQSTTLIEGKIVLVTTLYHSSGQWLRGYLSVNPVKNDPQAIGSALTYARRYALSAMVGLTTEEDDDGESAMGRVPQRQSYKEKPDPRDEIPFEEAVPAESSHTTYGNAEKSNGNAPTSDSDWRGVQIHFGKNKGHRLGTLDPKSLSWYITKWEPRPYNGKISEQDTKLREALDLAATDVEEA